MGSEMCIRDSNGGLLASAVAYRPTTGWTALPPMPHAAFMATSCVLNGRLFVAGGIGCDKLQMWDGTAWHVKADLPAARYGASSGPRITRAYFLFPRVKQNSKSGPGIVMSHFRHSR